MITLYTTTKDFTGQNRINQLNAIRSWLAEKCKPQIIIFGKSKGIEELGSHPNLLFVNQVNITPSGAPFANEMFDKINKLSKFKICCYVNADILLPELFFERAIMLHKKFKKKYLLVGERIDVDVENEMTFYESWLNPFIEKHGRKFKTHPPMGSDFFIYPKGQYTIDNMPEILIGRPGWDLWMIFNSRKLKHKVVDLSESVRVYHLNHDYSHKKVQYSKIEDDPEAMMNLKHVPHPFWIFTLLACNYVLKGTELSVNYSRGDVEIYNRIEKTLANKKPNLVSKIINRIKKIIN
jgi:hypothetical protein